MHGGSWVTRATAVLSSLINLHARVTASIAEPSSLRLRRGRSAAQSPPVPSRQEVC